MLVGLTGREWEARLRAATKQRRCAVSWHIRSTCACRSRRPLAKLRNSTTKSSRLGVFHKQLKQNPTVRVTTPLPIINLFFIYKVAWLPFVAMNYKFKVTIPIVVCGGAVLAYYLIRRFVLRTFLCTCICDALYLALSSHINAKALVFIRFHL